MKHALPPTRRTSTRTRAIMAGGLIAVTAAGVGGAVFASFTGSTSASQTIGSGTVSLTDIGVDGAGNRLSVAATNLAAGDTVQRAVTMTNAGSVDLSAIVLTTTATASSLLDTDMVTGLQMKIDRCSGTWVESGFPYTYTCSGGTVTPVLANRPVIGTNIALSNLALGASATNRLRVTLTLPANAGNALQGQASTIGYTFTGTQRAATSR